MLLSLAQVAEPTNTSQARMDGPPHPQTATPEPLANGKLKEQKRDPLQNQ